MNRRTLCLYLLAAIVVSAAILTGCKTQLSATPPSAATTPPLRVETVNFAIIGDYGMDNDHEAEVASLVASWKPAYVITTGDDYYGPAGGTGTGKYDESTGAYYGNWLKDISTTGSRAPIGGATVNAFFPSLGNHDYTSASLETYLAYFTLPGEGFTNSSGNERYYDYVQGPIHFFVLNSNEQEPDGTNSTSIQGEWLKTQLAASRSTWNIVYDHHPPSSSDDRHGSTEYMRWPFAAWGADAVISGHSHTYERVMRDGIVYFVNGLGGAERYTFRTPVTGSAVRFQAARGAQRVTVGDTALDFEFFTAKGELIDSYHLPVPSASGN